MDRSAAHVDVLIAPAAATDRLFFAPRGESQVNVRLRSAPSVTGSLTARSANARGDLYEAPAKHPRHQLEPTPVTHDPDCSPQSRQPNEHHPPATHPDSLPPLVPPPPLLLSPCDPISDLLRD